MKKIFAVLLFVAMSFLATGIISAKEGAYKNSLLKIELTKLDDNNYDIGLYTQKIYNEPVKVVRKSDTVYYLLLPETNHAITSVNPLGAINNVVVKTYPYAGQDVDNGYTKVAILTSKPLNLSTSLRTLDTSVSPKLDPARLARLDEVFERYSKRLIANNIPSPLNDFTKTASNDRPSLQSNVNVKNNVIAHNTVNSFTDYQDKNNKAQAEKKRVEQKPVTASIKSKPVTQKAAPSVKPAAQKTVTPPKQQTVVQKILPVLPQKKEEVQKLAKAPEKPLMPEKAPSKNVVVTPEPHNKVQSSDIKTMDKIKDQIKELEPIDIEFKSEQPTDTAKDNNQETKVQEPLPQTKEALEPSSAQSKGPDKNVLYICLASFVLLLGAYSLIRISKKKKLAADIAEMQRTKADVKDILRSAGKKENAEAVQEDSSFGAIEPFTIEDSKPNEYEQIQPEIVDTVEPQDEIAYETESLENENEQTFDEFVKEEKEEEEDSFTKQEDYGFDMDNNIDGTLLTEEEDEALKQLSTPIDEAAIEENAASDIDYYSLYSEETKEESASYKPSYQTETEPVEEDEDSATILSSSKLTETRGLYLARFEGATSLVGYIQDDIYVLYNFSDDVVETNIESHLAEENDTESLYIVKTGGKKLMVKSSPYDMKLEMVM